MGGRMKQNTLSKDNQLKPESTNWEMPQMMRKFSLTAVLAAGFLLLGSVGCAEEVGEIDRTSPNRLKKTALSGTWYMLQTMIDVPQHTTQGFIGNTNFGGNAKVMFEITENWVYIVPVTETVQFAEAPYKLKKVRNYWDEGKSNEFVEMWVGQPISAFPVTKHFDVIREYNTQTGAESNVLVENDTDRPWYEREYMRVDWGANGLYDWAFPIGTTKFQAVDHYVQEVEDGYLQPDGAGENPDLPEFTGDYVSFVTKAFIPPMESDWQGGPCNPYGVSNKDCGGAVIKLRWSFKKTEPTPDYETLVYKNSEHMDKFGFFLADRYAYDDLYNLTETLRDYKAQRWNMWQTTWNYYEVINDDTGAPVQCRFDWECGTDEVVLDYEARRCHKEAHFELGTCKKARLKQFKDRGLRPIIYHLSPSIPAELHGQFYRSADEWNQVFKETVAWALALEELGRYWTKSCSSNTDCTDGRDDVLLDTAFSMPRIEDGQLEGVACNINTNPCGKSQLCQVDQGGVDGLCYFKNADGTVGEQVTTPSQQLGRKSATAVVYEKSDGTLGLAKIQDDGQPSASAGQAQVRFVNVSGGQAQLNFNGNLVVDAPDLGDAWLVDTASAAAGQGQFTVGGLSADATLTVGRVYAVVYNGSRLVVTQFPQGVNDGVRVLNATGTSFDTGVNNVRAGQSVAPGAVTAYAPKEVDEVRVTALASGAQGDVTCYYTLHEGRCVGWAGEYADAEAKFREKLQQVPDMWLVCENIYDAASEITKYNEAVVADDKSTIYHDGRYTTKGKNPYFTDITVTADEYYNPCESMVPDPYSLKKIGDVRYNYIYWVGPNQAASPLGYGPSAGDPETGQLIWGTAYVYGAPTLTYGQWAADMVDMINGRLDDADVVSGEYIKDFMERKGDPLPWDNSGTNYHGGLKHFEHQHGMDPAVVAQAAQQFAADGSLKPGIDGRALAEISDFVTNKQLRRQLLAGVPSVATDYTQTRMDKIRGTFIEDLMINEEVKMAFGPNLEPGESLTEDMRKQLSPATWGTGAAIKAKHQTWNRLMATAPCSFDREFVDDNIYGLAKEHFCTQDEIDANDPKCKEGDALRWELTNRILSGLIEHEVGHTIGLRHNFGGSADLFNFHDEYFEVRSKDLVYCSTANAGYENSHCDEDGGEICQNLSCDTNTPCPAGLSCDAGQCVNGAKEVTGVCWEFERCKTDTECSSTINGTSVGQVCAPSSQCLTVADCKAGLDCFNGKCVDENQQQTGICSETPDAGVTVTPGRRAIKFAPRSFMTQQEALGKMSEYQYSTVMDYGGTFNSDVHGLGKYDYAAIKFAYAGLVDVYANPAKITRRINTLAKRFSRDPSNFSYFLDTSGWRSAGVIFSPFYYLEDYIGVEENRQRSTVAYEQVKLEHAMQNNYDHGELYWTHIEVPYRFCSDEYRGNLGCYTWDTGVDVGEMVANAINKINEYYVFDAFKRESMFKGADGFVNSYFNRVLTRYMNILADAGRYFAIYDNIFNERPWYETFTQNIYSMGVLASASRTAFNQLAQIMATPAPGSFMKDQDNVYRNVTYELDQQGTDLTIPLGVGKFPYTQYIDPDHYGFENHVLWVGSYWLKYAALLTLTDSTFYSSSDWVGEQLEIGRSTAVGFNTLYQREMTNLIGGIVAESLDAYSGVIDIDANSGKAYYRSRDLFDPTADAGKDVIEPGLNNLSLKLQAAVFGLSNLPAGFDPSFTDSMAVFLEGQSNEYEINAAGGGQVTRVEFNDPFGGKTYVAYTPNYDTGRLAPAYEIVLRAQNTRTKWETATGADKLLYERQMKKDIEMLDILKSLHVVYGGLVY